MVSGPFPDDNEAVEFGLSQIRVREGQVSGSAPYVSKLT
jgi:hypothetical protein